jgi:hypothetical protein
MVERYVHDRSATSIMAGFMIVGTGVLAALTLPHVTRTLLNPPPPTLPPDAQALAHIAAASLTILIGGLLAVSICCMRRALTRSCVVEARFDTRGIRTLMRDGTETEAPWSLLERLQFLMPGYAQLRFGDGATLLLPLHRRSRLAIHCMEERFRPEAAAARRRAARRALVRAAIYSVLAGLVAGLAVRHFGPAGQSHLLWLRVWPMVSYMPLTFVLLIAFLPALSMAKNRWVQRRRRLRERRKRDRFVC